MNPFSVFSKLGLWPRILGAVILWSLGIFVHFYLEFIYLLGLALIFLPAPLLSLKTLTNKPKDQGKEDWRAVGSAEVDTLRDNITQSLKLRKNIAALGCLPVLVIIAGVIGFFVSIDENPVYLMIVVDGVIILLTGVLPTSVNVYIPQGVPMKLGAFEPLLHAVSGNDLVLTPYLRFDVDENGKDLPEDIRFMLEPRRKPEDFIGIQFQCAINNGPNGAVPYVYAVALFKGKGGPGSKTAGKPSISGYVVEQGGDENWSTIVVRQETGGGGYYTNSTQVEHLLKIMSDLAQKIAKN